MYKNNNGNPAPIAGSLSDVLDAGTGSELPIFTQITHNMGNRTFLLSLPMKTFYDRSIVANARGDNDSPVSQRPLNIPHATKLAKYMFKGLVYAAQFKRESEGKELSNALVELEELLGKQPYVSMQPLVCNLRDVNPKLSNLRGERILSEGTKETVGFKVWLPQSQLFYVVDGQHRRKAMQLLFDFLNHTVSSHVLTSKGNLLTPLKGDVSENVISALLEVLHVASAFSTVQIECHLGLDADKERQLFHDLNNLGKKVEASLALQFDNSNPVNVFMKEVLIDDNSILNWDVIEKDIVDWHKDNGAISRKDLVSVNARLFLNKTNISGAVPAQIDPKKEAASLFWKQISLIEHLGENGAKMKSVAAQPVVLKALAKLAYDFGFGKKEDQLLFNKFIGELPNIDFSHGNPMWRYYQLNDEDRKELGIESLNMYLPSDDEGYNRDIGQYDLTAKTMRFGAKHNDIFPILGDMIRWHLDLPSRKK